MNHDIRFPTVWPIGMNRLKRTCVASFLAKKLQTLFGKKLYSRRIFKRLAKTLTKLRVCTGWSEHLLVAHTTLLKISCRGSIISDKRKCVQVSYLSEVM